MGYREWKEKCMVKRKPEEDGFPLFCGKMEKGIPARAKKKTAAGRRAGHRKSDGGRAAGKGNGRLVRERTEAPVPGYEKKRLKNRFLHTCPSTAQRGAEPMAVNIRLR